MEQERIEFWNNPLLTWENALQKLQQTYQVKPVEIEVNGHTIELLKVSNIDDLLDRANDPDEIPFWAELWPSSIGLASHILHQKPAFTGQTVLELGAGTGLAGIAAKMAGSQVVQSDFSIEALRFTQLNCLKNQVTATKLLLADWRNFPLGIGSFDWIIGADILYEKNLHRQLFTIFKQTLKPAGTILLADPGRNYAADFIREAVKNGWLSEQFTCQVLYEGASYKIDIYQLYSAGT